MYNLMDVCVKLIKTLTSCCFAGSGEEGVMKDIKKM